ncbi:MAG: glycosyltransferase family 4 protein [Bacteroidota bacterium]
MMKLLELTRLYYPSVGGAERFVRDRLRLYDQLGIEYKLITTDFSTEKKDNTVPVDNVVYLKQYTPFNITPSLIFQLNGTYDVVSINFIGRFFSDVALALLNKRKQKIILTPYFGFHTPRFSPVKSFYERTIFPLLLGRIDALVALTQYEKDFWIQRFRVPERKIHRIPPFIEKDVVPVSMNAVGDPYILYIGRAGGNKKTDLLLKTFLSLRSLPYTLVMTIRPEDIDASLRAAVSQDRRIRLKGFVTEREKHDLLSGAEALIFPTSWESFGYVGLEASQHRKPVLCSDIPVLREVLDPRGVIFFQNTDEALQEALLKFSSLQENDKKRMGECNYANLERYSAEVSLRQYREMFDSIHG